MKGSIALTAVKLCSLNWRAKGFYSRLNLIFTL